MFGFRSSEVDLRHLCFHEGEFMSTDQLVKSPAQGAKIQRFRGFDGFRGFAMLILMAAHFGAGKYLPGAWLGINFFLVFSGFIIIYLMMVERASAGRVQIIRFYRRRAKRLLPGLFLLLTTLAVWALLFAEEHVKRDLRGDIFATLGYVMNWRLIITSDDYFAQGGVPSLLRHAWTLAVEEQFYIVAPFLVLAIMRWVHSRWKRVAIASALAFGSAWIAADIGNATPSALAHAYYGTDTRAQAIFVGIAFAFLLGPDKNGREPRRPNGPLMQTLGWVSAAFNVWLYTWVEPTDPWVFESYGILLVSASTLPAFVVCMDHRENLLKRVIGNRVFILLGLMTYGLYLWHWPIQIWLNMYAPALTGLPLLIIGTLLTVAISYVSFRWLEVPIILRGLDAFAGSKKRARLLLCSSISIIIVLALLLGLGPRNTPNLHPDIEPYVPAETETQVAVFGDSSARFFFDEIPADTFSDLTIHNLAVDGCDIVRLDVKWTDEVSRSPEVPCLEARETLAADLGKIAPDVFVLMSGGVASLEHISADGRVIDMNTPEYRHLVEQELDDIFSAARSAGIDNLGIMTVPCRENDLSKVSIFGVDISPYFLENPEKGHRVTDPVEINKLFVNWAQNNGVEVIDLYGALGCQNGFQRKLNGITLFRDWFHFSEQASAMIWTWLAPTIRENFPASTK